MGSNLNQKKVFFKKGTLFLLKKKRNKKEKKQKKKKQKEKKTVTFTSNCLKNKNSKNNLQYALFSVIYLYESQINRFFPFKKEYFKPNNLNILSIYYTQRF